MPDGRTPRGSPPRETIRLPSIVCLYIRAYKPKYTIEREPIFTKPLLFITSLILVKLNVSASSHRKKLILTYFESIFQTEFSQGYEIFVLFNRISGYYEDQFQKSSAGSEIPSQGNQIRMTRIDIILHVKFCVKDFVSRQSWTVPMATDNIEFNRKLNCEIHNLFFLERMNHSMNHSMFTSGLISLRIW